MMMNYLIELDGDDYVGFVIGGVYVGRGGGFVYCFLFY